MLADFLTKPLQGALFLKFKRVLMGHAHVSTLSSPTMAPTEERVGSGIKRNEVNMESEKNAVVTTVAADEKFMITTRSKDKDTSGVPDEEWITVKGRTKQVRMSTATPEPMNLESEKPMENKPVMNGRRSHSFV